MTAQFEVHTHELMDSINRCTLAIKGENATQLNKNLQLHIQKTASSHLPLYALIACIRMVLLLAIE